MSTASVGDVMNARVEGWGERVADLTPQAKQYVDVDKGKHKGPDYRRLFLMLGAVMLILLVIVLGVHKASSSKTPVLSATDALAIRDAQIDFLRVSAQIEGLTATYNTRKQALDAAVTTGVKDAGLDPSKFTVQENGGKLVILPVQATPEQKK